MIELRDFALFALTAAAVIDTALLLALLDRANRRRLVLPLLLIVAGAWLYHSGSAVHILLETTDTLPWLDHLAMLAMLFGALLMPCALLHGLWRADSLGWQAPPADGRQGLWYLPLLLPLLGLPEIAEPARLAERMVALRETYIAVLIAVTVVAAGGFFRLQSRFIRPWARRFMLLAGVGLLLLALLLGGIVFIALPLWPQTEPLWRLVVALSPLPLVLLVGYFIIRFHFLQLVLGRVFVYGAVVVAVVLFHQIILSELWQTLSEHYRVNFAVVSGLAIAALVLMVPALRSRSAEALRYLLGQRVDRQRQRSRNLVMAMAAHCGKPEADVLEWFISAAQQAFEVRYLAVWLYTPTGDISAKVGAVERLTDAETRRLWMELRSGGLAAACLGHSPPAIEDSLMAAGAAVAVRMDHPAVEGLVLVGHGPGEWYAERVHTLVLVVEQLAITLHTGRLQSQRLAAERRALQQDKLAALGLVASSVAHEVKNPLSSIRTLATLMAEELGTDTPHAEDLRHIISELDRLALNVKQLLQFARPSNGDEIGVDLAEVLSGMARILRHLATHQGVNLEIPIPQALPRLRMPAGVLREILFNLLNNAIEAAHSQVTVYCYRDDTAVVIELSDDGPGIPESVGTQLFQPFVTSRTDGTGLGLYLVGRHVQDWGGQIDYQSMSPQGTQFRLRLPLWADCDS